MADISDLNIRSHDFPVNQYFRVKTKKVGVVLHHTVSGGSGVGDIHYWKKSPSRVGTPIIIDRSGLIHRLFSTNYWIHHLGIKNNVFRQHGFSTRTKGTSRNIWLNQRFIGIEFDSWGGLVRRDGKMYNAYGQPVECEVSEYAGGYRGYNYFEKYTDKQIEAARRLILYWSEYYDFNPTYHPNMWEVNSNALAGEEGVHTHTGFRPDKSDCHPQTELIEMIKSIQ